ncbi:MAG: hypothetical protein Q8K29_11190 [Polaromonas sp.]|nr:hypothetical protein [Polaromonas sp.]
MEKPYMVALEEANDLPPAERIAAEVRFVREIERTLGSSEDVATVYRAWLEASESDVASLGEVTANLAARWPRAADAAYRAGFKGIGDIGEAHFKLRLPRASALV